MFKFRCLVNLNIAITAMLLFFPYALQAQDDVLLTVPVRIYLIDSDEISLLDANITSEEVYALFKDVNIIWQQANISFEVESIIEHNSVAENRYLQALDGNSELTNDQRRLAMSEVCRIPGWENTVLNLCIVGQMPNLSSGGRTYRYNNHFPLVVWPVEINFKKYLNPATLAHEFGHFLSLTHSSDPDIYLMRGGGNNMRRIGNYDKVLINESEIRTSRQIARTLLRNHWPD